MSAEQGMPMLATRLVEPASVPRGRVLLRRLRSTPRLRYYLYWPDRLASGRPPLVAVHGISLNAREQARVFAASAAALGVPVIAPLFEPDVYLDFQRLGRAGRGARADLALLAVLDEVKALTGHALAQINLFGFSGGGQFCHRFTMAHPSWVQRQVLAAPGWYTLPAMRRRYPLGLCLADELPGVTFDPAQFLQVPTCVLVGADDTERDAALRLGRRIDRLQGRDRVARGRSFVSRMRRAAARRGIDSDFEFATLPNCGHDFDEAVRTGALVQRTLSFLYRYQPSATEKN